MRDKSTPRIPARLHSTKIDEIQAKRGHQAAFENERADRIGGSSTITKLRYGGVYFYSSHTCRISPILPIPCTSLYDKHRRTQKQQRHHH